MSIELIMDDGLQGEFKAIYNGTERRQIISNGIEQGRIYRLRYRVLNAQGWSPYSDKTFVLAAS